MTKLEYFEVHPKTGIVRTIATIKGKIRKDFLTLTVTADDGNLDHATDVLVKVRILKNRDERIIFISPSHEMTSFQIPEDYALGSLITTFKAEKVRKTVEDVYDVDGLDDVKTMKNIRGDNYEDYPSDYVNDDPFSIYEGLKQYYNVRKKRQNSDALTDYGIVKTTLNSSYDQNFPSTKSGINKSVIDKPKTKFKNINEDSDGVMIIYEFLDPFDILTNGVRSHNKDITDSLYEDILNSKENVWASLVSNKTKYLQTYECFCLNMLTGNLTLCMNSDETENKQVLDRESKDSYNFTVIAKSISVIDQNLLNFSVNPSTNKDEVSLQKLKIQGKKVVTLASAYTFVRITVLDVDDNQPKFILRSDDQSKSTLVNLNDQWFRTVHIRTTDSNQTELNQTFLIPPTIRFYVDEDDSTNETHKYEARFNKNLPKPATLRLGTDEYMYWKNHLARGNLDVASILNRPTREVGTLNVSDPDLGDNATFFFCMICADFPEDHVTVDYYSGRLISTSHLDREVRSTYSALVIVKPGPFLPCEPPIYQNYNYTQPDFFKQCSGKLKELSNGSGQEIFDSTLSTAIINITVNDVNDHAPKLERSTFYVGLPWRTNQGATVTEIMLSDGDSNEECCRNYSISLSELSYYGEKGRPSHVTKTLKRSQYEKWFNIQYRPSQTSGKDGESTIVLKNGIIGLERYVDGYFKMKITVRDRKRSDFKDSAIIYVWIYGEGRTLTVAMDVLENMKPKDISYKFFSEIISHAISNNIILSTLNLVHRLKIVKKFIEAKGESLKVKEEAVNVYDYDYALPIKYSFEFQIQVVDRLSFNLLSEHQIMHLIDSKPESLYHFRISPMTVTSIRPKRSYLKEIRTIIEHDVTIPTFGQPNRLLTIMVFAIFVTMISGGVIFLLWIIMLAPPDCDQDLKAKSKENASTFKKDKDIYTVATQSLVQNTRTNPLWMEGTQNPIHEKTIETVQKYYF